MALQDFFVHRTDVWMEHAPALMIGGGVLALAGLGLWWVAWRKDQKNYIVEKATPMLIGLVNVHDDVWIAGRTKCSNPLRVPHFGIESLYYDYRKEKKVTSTNSKGRTSTRWDTVASDSLGVPFEVVEDQASLWIDPTQADLDGLPATGYDYEGGLFTAHYRHCATYLPHPVRVSVLGSVSEGKEWLRPYKNIPLIVTTRHRKQYLKSIEKGEAVARWFGFFLLPVGLFGVFTGLVHHTGWMGYDPEEQTVRLAASGAAAVLAFTLLWLWQAYNRLVMYRIRVGAAWNQIDVDLKNRYDLIPNLVEVVKGYSHHEARLLEELARLRTGFAQSDMRGKIGQEQQTAQQVKALIAVVERYPDLKANEVFMKLHEELVALEEKIAHGRSFFNDRVQEYNTTVERFPVSMIFRRPPVPYFRGFEESSS